MTRQEAIPKLTQKPFQPKDEFRLLKFVQMLLSETYYYLVRGRLPSGTRDEVSDIRRETFELYVTIRTGVYDLYEYKFYEMENIDPMQLRKMKQACKDKAYRTTYAAEKILTRIRIHWEVLLGIEKGSDGADIVTKMQGFSAKRQAVFREIHNISQYLTSYLAWLKDFETRYPHVLIENCGSGGCRMDYAMLSVHALQSISDQVDYRNYPYIAGNMLSAVLPEQAGVWSYPCAGESFDDEVVIFNMVNGLLGRIHLASDLRKLNDEQKELVKEGIKYYHRLTPYKKKALPYLPLGFTDFSRDFAASGLLCGKSAAAAFFIRRAVVPLRCACNL